MVKCVHFTTILAWVATEVSFFHTFKVCSYLIVYFRTNRQPTFVKSRLNSIEVRKVHLFTHLISKNDVAIGPLEYYGSAFVYKVAGGDSR